MSVPSVSSEEGRQTPSQSHLIKEVGEVDEDVTSGDGESRGEDRSHPPQSHLIYEGRR